MLIRNFIFRHSFYTTTTSHFGTFSEKEYMHKFLTYFRNYKSDNLPY